MESVISLWKQNAAGDSELTAELVELERAPREEIENRFSSDLRLAPAACAEFWGLALTV